MIRSSRRSAWAALALAVVIGCSPAASGPISPYADSNGPLTVADVLTYKGGNDRRGVMPGPGPMREPVVLWELPLAAGTFAGPLIADGEVIVVGGDGTILGIDPSSGRVAWDLELAAGTASTPSVADGVLYVVTIDGTLRTVSLADRALGWTASGYLPESIITVAGDLVLVGVPGAIVALNRFDGREAWRADAPGSDRVAIDDGIAFVGGDGSGTMLAVRIEDHAPIWRVETGGARVLTPAVVDGSIYVAARDVSGGGSAVRRVEPDGSVRWSTEPPGRAEIRAHAVLGDRVFVSVDQPGGAIIALDGTTGERLWETPFDGPIVAIPAVDRDQVYAASTPAGVAALDPVRGTVRWRVGIGPIEDAELAVSGGLVFVTTRDIGGSGRVLALAAPDDPRVAAMPSAAATTPSPAPTTGAPPLRILSETPVPGRSLLLSTAVAPDGTVYVADMINSRIVVRHPDGSLELWGERGSGPGQFDFSPVTTNDSSTGVAVSPDGELIAVGDGANHRVQLFDADRKWIRSIGRLGREDEQFINPCCVTIDADHNLWVVDVARADVQVFDEAGRHVRTFAGPGSGAGQLLRPGPVFIADDPGEVYVPDFSNRRVAVFSTDGTWLRNHGSRPDEGLNLDEVNAVVVDASGRMFVVDTTSRTFVLSPAGALEAIIANDLPGAGRVEYGSLALDSDGRFYFADIGGGSAGRIIIAQLDPPLWPE